MEMGYCIEKRRDNLLRPPPPPPPFSDKGILMTFGSGANGCLGHGDRDDVKEVREGCMHIMYLTVAGHNYSILIRLCQHCSSALICRSEKVVNFAYAC